MKNKTFNSLSGTFLDTLGQNGTDYSNNYLQIVCGKGSDLTKDIALKGRAKRKGISQVMSLNLIEVAKKIKNLNVFSPIGILFIAKIKLPQQMEDFMVNTAKTDFAHYVAASAKLR